jgi:pimeloyl-ACP methyl ester carboxylesterase
VGRRIASTLVLASLAGGVVAGCGSEESDDAESGAGSDPGVPSISVEGLEECRGKLRSFGFRCGSIEVPFEREDPSLGRTTIAFAVLPHRDRRRDSEGAIFAVEGGPGYSSTGTANAYTKLFGGLLETRELVLVDMRGTGLSEPLDCPDLQRGRGPEMIALSECARRLGDRFESYRTAAAADDIDDVREALGHERIALYGDSYGTFLAQSYAYRYPGRLDALVLDSAYPTYGESAWYQSLIRTGVRSLELACERSPRCDGDAGRRLEKLVEYLRRTNRDVGALVDALAGAGYSPPGAYLAIDRAGTALRHGDSEAWGELTAEGKPGHPKLRSYSRASELVTGCNDYPMIWDREATEPERRAQLEAAIREYDPEVLAPFSPREVQLASDFGYLECLTWPARTERYEPPAQEGDEPTDAPVLVVGGEFDDVTTPHEGKVVARQFPDSSLFVERNAGHTAALYDSSGPSATEIRRFLREALKA